MNFFSSPKHKKVIRGLPSVSERTLVAVQLSKRAIGSRTLMKPNGDSARRRIRIYVCVWAGNQMAYATKSKRNEVGIHGEIAPSECGGFEGQLEIDIIESMMVLNPNARIDHVGYCLCLVAACTAIECSLSKCVLSSIRLLFAKCARYVALLYVIV
ncbi:hypothetical protein Tco_0696170 [Tanacetum coccineum]